MSASVTPAVAGAGNVSKLYVMFEDVVVDDMGGTEWVGECRCVDGCAKNATAG